MSGDCILDDLYSYIGSVLVIAAIAAAIYFLKRNGIRLRRLKHGKTELEFESGHTCGNPDGSKKKSTFSLNPQQIVVSELANSDSTSQNIELGTIRDFLLAEAKNHPAMFSAPFSSLALIFDEMIILASWDSTILCVERMLTASQAYPSANSWAECLRLYRGATLLPYRYDSTTMLQESKGKVALNHFARLTRAMHSLKGLLTARIAGTVSGFEQLDSLLEEAETAFHDGSLSMCVSRLETLLSVVHKLILRYAPCPKDVSDVPTRVLDTTSGDPKEKPVILVVDDEAMIIDYIGELLRSDEFRVILANSPADALKQLVNEQVDILITDVVMPHMDGIELVRTAKKADSSLKCVIISGFTSVSVIDEFLDSESGDASFLAKPFSNEALLSTIKAFLKGVSG